MHKIQENHNIALDLDYVGKEALFQIFQSVQDQSVLEHVILLIVEHYSNFAEHLQQNAHGELMDKCLYLMPKHNTRCISLL